MITDILLYQITLKQEVPFLFFFSRTKDIVYQLHYRVDEDRFFFTKKEGRKVCDEHHTKNNIHRSFNILEGILKRIETLHAFRDYKYTIFDLRKENPILFQRIEVISKNLEKLTSQPHSMQSRCNQEESSNENHKMKGFLLP